MTNETKEIIPYTHSFKIEPTAQGLRFHCHVYGFDPNKIVDESFEMYNQAVHRALAEGKQIAPFEVKVKKI